MTRSDVFDARRHVQGRVQRCVHRELGVGRGAQTGLREAVREVPAVLGEFVQVGHERRVDREVLQRLDLDDDDVRARELAGREVGDALAAAPPRYLVDGLLDGRRVLEVDAAGLARGFLD